MADLATSELLRRYIDNYRKPKFVPRPKFTRSSRNWKGSSYPIRGARPGARPKVDTKFIDTEWDNSSVDINGSYKSDLCVCTQGTSLNQRTGLQILAKSLDITLRHTKVFGPATASTQFNYRFVVGMYHQGENDFDPLEIYDINLESQANYTTGYRNMNHTKKYTILRDIKGVYQPSYTSTSANVHYYNVSEVLHLNLKNVPIHYSGNAGTVADLQSNGLFVLFFPPEDENVTLNASIRFKFTG